MQNEKCKMKNEKCRRCGCAARANPHFAFCILRSRRSAVTLIELLIVMLIISILAGLILGVAAVAGETARQRQSEHTVLRLHKLLMEHYDTYKTRRVEIRDEVLQGITAKGAQKGRLLASARLHALRELMLMEIPDRWSDITLGPPSSAPLYPFFLDISSTSTGRTPLSAIYLRRYQQYAAAANTSAKQQALFANQGAECLYLIITLACGDGEARSQFGEDSIGDTDGDGAYEFLDGWGRPISFLRWAPGFDSLVQINANKFLPLPVSQAWQAEADGDHDPFDLYRMDRPAFRLVPLIFSAGRDESYGIQVDAELDRIGLRKNKLDIVPSPDSWSIILPWAPVTNPADDAQVFLGTAIPDGGSADNIHNHLLGRR
jgi:prepilin-type N-terminal cleavage/methylation domain-containing protein